MLLLALLLAGLRLQDERLVARVADVSGDVQASSCQGHLLLAWREGAGIAAAVDGRRLAVSAAARGTPAVACGRASWLIVWPSDDFGVDGRRVGFDGAQFDRFAVFRGAFGASEVGVAYGENAFLVAWVDGVTVRALRVSDAGAVVDAAPIAVAPGGLFAAPRVVWTGSAFFVVWSERSANPFLVAPVRLWGTRVTADGKADAVALPMIADGGLAGERASVTANGERIALAWVAEHGTRTCVDVAQVNESRVVLAPPSQLRCSDDAGVPVLDEAQVRWNRGEYVLVWRELRSDFSSVLRVATLDGQIQLLAERARGAALASDANGVAAAYFAAFPPPNEVTLGVFVRVIEQDQPPARRRAARH